MTLECQVRRFTLICDLDGTLVDSAPDLAGSLVELLAQEERAPLSLAEVKSMIGDGMAKLVERGLSATGSCPKGAEFENLVRRFIEIYNHRLVAETKPYPDAVRVLSALQADGWRLLVCTNKHEAQSREILENLELAPLFESVAGGDSFPYRKPDPRHLLNLLDQVKAAPETAVMFGDGSADVAAARAAGIPSVLSEFGYGGDNAKREGPDQLVTQFQDLPAALRHITALTVER